MKKKTIVLSLLALMGIMACGQMTANACPRDGKKPPTTPAPEPPVSGE